MVIRSIDESMIHRIDQTVSWRYSSSLSAPTAAARLLDKSVSWLLMLICWQASTYPRLLHRACTFSGVFIGQLATRRMSCPIIIMATIAGKSNRGSTLYISQSRGYCVNVCLSYKYSLKPQREDVRLGGINVLLKRTNV